MVNMMSKTSMVTDRIKKTRRVKYILACLRSESIEPDESDMVLIQAYIDGTISLKDLISHTLQFSTEMQYHEWIRDSNYLTGDNAQKTDLNNHFLTEMVALIRRKHHSHRK